MLLLITLDSRISNYAIIEKQLNFILGVAELFQDLSRMFAQIRRALGSHLRHFVDLHGMIDDPWQVHLIIHRRDHHLTVGYIVLGPIVAFLYLLVVRVVLELVVVVFRIGETATEIRDLLSKSSSQTG